MALALKWYRSKMFDLIVEAGNRKKAQIRKWHVQSISKCPVQKKVVILMHDGKIGPHSASFFPNFYDSRESGAKTPQVPGSREFDW